jgi:ATP-binding cassette subfamily F protein 3
MFRLETVSLRYGGREIFKNLSWQVGTNDRIALVGPNGAGKTTLLKVLAGIQEIDKGEVITGKNTTIGYLPQEGIVHSGSTIFVEARSVFEPLLVLKRRSEEILHELEHLSHEDPRFEGLIEQSHTLEDRFRNGGGYQIESDVGNVLKGLGFEKDDWDRPTESYSGGWQMRLALARLLLQRPNLLLLDEPTNHLDLEAREWLAEYLRSYPFAVVLVSHDKSFLDAVVGRIADLEHGTVTDYYGNYTYYQKEKELRRIAHAAAYQRQQEEIAEIEDFIERFRYKATKAAQVQSRVKMLEKLERLPPPPEPPRTVRFRFPEPLRSGDIVMDLLKLSKSYGQKTVLKDVELSIRRGEKLALVGPNGAGKSTLMRLLGGIEPPDGGIRRVGHQVMPSYFAQDQARTLTPGNTVLRELSDHAPLAGEGLLRSLLGGFLFVGEDVYKQVEVLSGGEKNRLALCKLLAVPGNLLLLDEPTNHLDMTSKEVLLDALQNFSGTVVFVSHDRFFLEELSTRVVEVGNGKAVDYPGTYREFLDHKRRLAQPFELETRSASGASEVRSAVKVEAADAFRERKKASRQLQKQQQRLELVQKLIEQKEQEVVAKNEQMADPQVARDYNKLLELEKQRTALSREIEGLYEEWESLSAELEESS